MGQAVQCSHSVFLVNFKPKAALEEMLRAYVRLAGGGEAAVEQAGGDVTQMFE